MVKINYIFSLIICFSVCLYTYGQQITTDDSLPLEQLIQDNLGQNCVEISNIASTVNGSINGFNSYGFFERGNSDFPFHNGIVLTTGNVNSAGNTLNTSPLNEGDDAWLTDTDLENALGISNTLNATSIQFNFISVANQIQFNYLLASEEYQQEYPCFYSDGFAFLIREAGTSDPFNNIALIPGTSTPVNTNTVHDEIETWCSAANEAYFEGYNVGDTNYNGRTVVLTATAAIMPNVEYEIKLVIADQSDQNFDSAVFIEGNSFNANVDLGPDISTCGDSVMLNGDIQNPQASYQWYKDNTLIDGANASNFEATASGSYKVEVTIQLGSTSCVIEDVVDIILNSEQASTQISDFIYCDDPSNDGVETFDLTAKNNEVLASVPPSNYLISYHYSNEDALDNNNPITTPIENTSSPQPIFVRIEDAINGCLAYSTFNLVVNQKPDFVDPDPIIACEDPTLDGYTLVDLNLVNDQIINGNNNLYITYHYSLPEADLGSNPIFSPYANFNTSETLYVRIYDSTTGCYSTTTIDVQFQDTPPINLNDQWVGACAPESENGLETFDLTSIIDSVLQGATGLDVSFHITLYEAHNNINPISDPENYQNTSPYYQLLYIRVQDPETGCYAVVNLELFSSIIQSGFSQDAVIVCDDVSDDGIADFNLVEVQWDISNGYPGFEFSFYLTPEDRDNLTNPIDKTIPFTVSNYGTTIYAIASSGICEDYIDIALEISPAIVLSPQTYDYCDEDDDGFTTLIMDTFNSTARQGVQAANVKYYLTEEDAINNENILPDYVYNSSNPQLFYIRVTNSQTECYDISTLQVNIVGAPTIFYPEAIIVCDDDNDGSSTVDLTSKIPEMVSATNGLNFSFYEDYNLALEGTPENAISNPDNFTTETTYIYARVENESSGCANLSGFYVYINTVPEFIPISNFQNCEADISGVADFYFYLKDEEILNGQTGKQVLYFETEADAIAGTNYIDKYTAYNNTSSPQTIYVRVENLTDSNCFATSSFELEVGSLPIFTPPTAFLVCDDISNDGVATLDLNVKIDEIVTGSPEILDVSFHLSQFDAESNINPIPLEFTNTTNPQELYARISNGTYCQGISAFEITVISAPVVNPSIPLEQCDTDYDGIVTWDLTISEIDILDVRQDNIEVSYFETVDDLEADTNPINTPHNYQNSTTPQTVYIKVNNTVSDCFVIVPLDLIVNLPPLLNDFETVEICDHPAAEFNFYSVDSYLTDLTTDLIFTYHNNQGDAETNSNPLPPIYNYTETSHSFVARVTNALTGCYSTYPFDLIINPLPVANLPDPLEACDDVTNDGSAYFNLKSQTSAVLGTQNANDFDVSYFETLNHAEINENPIIETNTYLGTNTQVIWVRIENNTTGCYNLTEFILRVNPHPNTPQPLVYCDTDYDGETPFNLTTAQGELFETSNPNHIISYFETVTDLENDLNAISNPENYSNTSNPQTVYIKVLDTVANCYTSVTLELYVNLPPPINTFQSIELCDNDTQTFDLNTINTRIVDSNFNVLISYYPSETDAINQTNALESPYTYTDSSTQLFARVAYSTTHCYVIYPFELRINPVPLALAPEDLEVCDDDYDEAFNFTLHAQTASILGFQNPLNYSVTYFNSILDAHENSNSLNANSYIGYNNEIITARVENNLTHCYSLVNFSLVVHRKPYVFIPTQVVCIDNLPLIVSAETFFDTDQYLWSNNSSNSSLEITEIGTYAVTVTSEFGCATTSTFEVIESASATIELTETVDFSDPNNITITISGIGNYQYILDDGEPQDSNTFENVTLGYHTITVIDLNGCAEVTKEVVVVDAPPFFTPNGDTHHDTWHIVGIETLPGSKVYIFDRYGKLIYQLSSESSGWDGTYNNRNMPANDYWFLAEIRQGNTSFEVRGNFALRR